MLCMLNASFLCAFGVVLVFLLFIYCIYFFYLRSVEAARTEAEIVIFDVVGSVLEKVGLTGKDIDFLIINCR